MRNRALQGVALLLVLGAIGAALWYFVDGRALVVALREHGGSWWAIPLYFLLYALLDILFIPTQFLSVAAALTWGWLRGGTIELLAATTGAIPPYLVARSTLRAWIVEKLKRHEKAARILDREGFTLLLLLRVVPIIPYTALNFVAGLTSLRLVPYVLATLLGMIPSTFIFAWFVQSLADGVMQPRDVTVRALAAGAAFAALVIATRLAAPHLRRRMSHEGHKASHPDGAHLGSENPPPPQE